jgi:hypothetical protein
LKRAYANRRVGHKRKPSGRRTDPPDTGREVQLPGSLLSRLPARLSVLIWGGSLGASQSTALVVANFLAGFCYIIGRIVGG